MGGAGGGWGRGRCLGRGSTATVFLANSSAAEQPTFAVKSAELCRSAPLQREQKVLSSLGHPHIVSYLGSDVTAEADGRVFYNLFMEYVPGGSLAEEIQKQGRLDERAIRVYTRAILGALMYIHHRGIVHCDVKAHNILLGKDAVTAKLADFGCARWLGESDGRVVAGTPLYMAPEAARGEDQGPPADIWALGCTVVEMASGGPAWRGVSDPVAALHRIAFSDDVPELPCGAISGEGEDFLTRCLNRDPAKRWSAEELLNHPFVSSAQESIAGGGLRNSPISVLDRDFWDSWQEDDEEDKSDTLVDAQSMASAHGCLRRLLGGVSPPPPPPASTTWEDSTWVTVRNSEDLRGRILQDETPAGSSGLAESSGDGVGSTEELAAHDDGNHVAATVSHRPPSSTYLSVAASVIVSISSAPTEEAMAYYSVDPRDFLLLVSRKPRSCPAIITTGVVTMMLLEFYNKHRGALPCSIAPLLFDFFGQVRSFLP